MVTVTDINQKETEQNELLTDTVSNSALSINSTPSVNIISSDNAVWNTEEDTEENLEVDTEGVDADSLTIFADSLTNSADSLTISADSLTDGSISEDDKANAPVVLITLLIFFAILAGVIIKLSKRKAAKTDIPVTVSPLQQNRAVLHSMSPQHGDLLVVVRSGFHVIIGKNPSGCKVIFHAGTEGVSGRHCSVSYDERTGEFIVTDMRSQAGTFLLDGRRLKPNVPYRLKAGEGFYLGNPGNTFYVEMR